MNLDKVLPKSQYEEYASDFDSSDDEKEKCKWRLKLLKSKKAKIQEIENRYKTADKVPNHGLSRQMSKE